jgi:hypothetical protein
VEAFKICEVCVSVCTTWAVTVLLLTVITLSLKISVIASISYHFSLFYLLFNFSNSLVYRTRRTFQMFFTEIDVKNVKKEKSKQDFQKYLFYVL